MKEIAIRLPDKAYEQLMAEASSAHISPARWIIDKLSAIVGPKPPWMSFICRAPLRSMLLVLCASSPKKHDG